MLFFSRSINVLLSVVNTFFRIVRNTFDEFVAKSCFVFEQRGQDSLSSEKLRKFVYDKVLANWQNENQNQLHTNRLGASGMPFGAYGAARGDNFDVMADGYALMRDGLEWIEVARTMSSRSVSVSAPRFSP